MHREDGADAALQLLVRGVRLVDAERVDGAVDGVERLAGQQQATHALDAAAQHLGGGLHHHEGGHDLRVLRSEEHTSELQSLMRLSYAVFCLTKKKNSTTIS